MSIPYYRYHPSPKKPAELEFCTFTGCPSPSLFTVNILVPRSRENRIYVLSVVVPASPLLLLTRYSQEAWRTEFLTFRSPSLSLGC